MSQPSFYAIIPATVRYCKAIEPSAKLLYGEITALSQTEGYCWATNEYFAELYDVDTRTIQRWLESLKNEKLIKVEIKKDGIKVERKIWISPEIQKIFTKRQKCQGGHDKNVVYSNTMNNTRKETPIIPKGDEREACGAFVKLSKEEYQKAKELCGDQLESLIEEMNDYCAAHGKKYKDYLAAIRTWWKKREQNPKAKSNSIDENAKWAKEVESKMRHVARCYASTNSFVFEGMGNYSGEYIKYSESGFKERIINRLRKMGLIDHLKDD